MEAITLIVIGICVLFLLLCFTIAAFLYVSGILSPIDVGAGFPPIGKATVAYKFARGPYKGSGDLFNEVTKHAPDYKCVGIYYDDPKRIPQEKLRFAVGAILSEGDVKVEQDLINQLQKAGFNLVTLPEVTHCVKTTFPFINTLSILIAVWRVYPRLSRYIEEHKLCAYPFLEIYEGSTIHFMAPLSMQEEFFVPESKENIPSEYEQDSLIDNTSGSPSFYDGSPSSSASRSMSRYTNASHMFSDDQDDSDMEDYSFYRGSPSMYRDTPSLDKEDLNLQDEEVTSTVDVRPSKAKTNLLEEDEVSPDDSNKMKQGSPVINEDKSKFDESSSMLHDSGVCSGRTSAVPSEANASLEVEKKGLEENDSASSFEEINM